MRDLILARGGDRRGVPLECLVPMRGAQLLNWAIDQGFAIVKTMNLMTSGAYREPAGSSCPSVLY
jgi:hypothetical protein